ncbi:hypothetical protein EON67_09665 [archaeon]|nr:MAG: hypothetical protein EON67_09665 [archaeon]
MAAHTRALPCCGCARCPTSLQLQLPFVDTSRFPEFATCTFQYAVLHPGDVLYIPSYWWYYDVTPWEDSMSIDFWYAAALARAHA